MGAKQVLSKSQRLLFIIAIAIILLALVVDYRVAIISVLTILTFFYFLNIIISFNLIYKSIFSGEEIVVHSSDYDGQIDKKWPKYSILCPLYKEPNVIKNFIENIIALDYPKEKLQCLLLLEEDDLDTIEAVNNLSLPSFFTVIIINHGFPKTKPKACNIGLRYATGEHLVIYDAEDKPEIDQLKKAVTAFSRVDSNIGCIQAKLNYYNPNQNFLTKMFASEYSLWFDLILPGFQKINAPIPLGGTSNHFKVRFLKKLGGWDPYNVTEDCDLGIRLKKAGYQTVILNSTTWEEANSNLKNWIRQRSRWIKGYFQTFLVHTRNPVSTAQQIGILNFLYFTMTTGFLPLASLINPFLWLTTFVYFAFRPISGAFIEQFYPPYLLYPAVFCLIAGNFLYVVNYLVGTTKKNLNYLTKYGLLAPIYWIFISVAGWFALFQLIVRPHYWEKTNHGLFEGGSINV